MVNHPEPLSRPITASSPYPQRIARILLHMTVPLWFKVRAQGLEHVPPRGGLLIVSNHQSVLDPVLVGITLRRDCHYMARDTLFKGLFGRFIAAVNAFPVRRGTADLGAMREGVRRLSAGHALCVFPEGTRSATGRIAPLLPGFIALARRGKVPILPIAIDGVVDLWPRGQRWPRRGPIWLQIGRPIALADLAGRSDAVTARLTADLRTLHNTLRKDVGHLPFDYNQPEENDSEPI